MNWDNNFYVVFYDRGKGRALTKGFSNRRILAEFTGISYSTLTNHFIRNKEMYHFYADKEIMIILVNGIMKGRQRIKRGPTTSERNFV